jgi:hypothetical protein
LRGGAEAFTVVLRLREATRGTQERDADDKINNTH